MDQSQTVLVIDDDRAVAPLVRAHIAGHGVNVVVVAEGAAGLEQAQAGGVDLILLDVGMPEHDGFEICKQLKADHATALIPIIFLTGSDDRTDRLRAFECGGADYITKPFNPEELRARVGSALRTQQLLAHQRQVELGRQKLVHTLGERVKELAVLQETGRLLNQSDAEPNEILPRITELLPGAFQWPSRTAACISFGDREFPSSCFRDGATNHAIKHAFTANESEHGIIEVVLRSDPPYEPAFLPEEQRLLKLVGDMLSTWLQRKQSEFALRESEMRYRLLTEHSSDMLSKHDRRGVCIFASPASRALLGYDPDDLIGRVITDLVHPRDRRHVVNQFGSQAGSRNGSATMMFRMRHRLGRYIRVEASASSIPGEEHHVLLVTRDITERYEANQALQRSEAELREQREVLKNVLTHIPYAVFWKDREGRYLGCNETHAQQLGVGHPRKVIGRCDADLWRNRRKADQVVHCDQEIMEAGQSLMNVEQSRERPDGTIETVLASRVPLRDAEAEIIGLLGIDADITERKRAEDALLASEMKLHAITSQLPALLWTADASLCVTSIHGAAVPELHDSLNNTIGCSLQEFTRTLRVGQSQMFFDVHESALLGESVNFEDECRDRNFDMRVEPLLDSTGRIIGTLGVAFDITERRLAEEAERKQKSLEEAIAAMEQVLGVIGHELRTPLAGLRVMSEYMITEAISGQPANEEFLTSINDEAVRLSEMVNTLLETARVNSGRARWNWSEFAVREVCEHALKLVQPLIEQEGIRLRFDIVPDRIQMRGDVDAVQRLVLNLLSNAQNHTSEGEISLTVRELCDHEGQWVTMDIRDSGEGIPEELRPGLGVPFALNSGVVGSSGGTGSGLGLALCNGIAIVHGGSIAIDSQLGEGTTVSVRLRADLDAPVAHEHTSGTLQGVAA